MWNEGSTYADRRERSLEKLGALSEPEMQMVSAVPTEMAFLVIGANRQDRQVDPAFRERMIALEVQLERFIQARIDALNCARAP